MTDPQVSPEGLQSRTLLSLSEELVEDSQDSPEAVASGSAVSSRLSGPRRRPLRGKSDPDASPRSTSPQWVDTNGKVAQKAKRSRNNTLRKPSGAETPNYSSSSKPPSEGGGTDKEGDTIGFLPKLSRILEGRESKSVRSSRSSVVSTSDRSTSSRQRRPVKDGTIGHRSRRRTQPSLQQRAESLANLPNSSLVSVLSSLTQHSHASSGSNSTVTQKSYDKGHISKRRPVQDRKRLQNQKSIRKQTAMESQAPDVFQYMDGELEPIEPETGPTPMSPVQSSGSEDEDDGEVSDEEEENDNPTTNFTAAQKPTPGGPVSDAHKRPDGPASHGPDGFRSDSGVSFRRHRRDIPQPAPHAHEYAPPHHADHEEEGDEEEESDSDDEDHSEHGVPPYVNYAVPPQHPGQDLMLHRDAPPRMPSASSASTHSDPHLRRLRDQERELRDHVLQPQPQRDIRFEGGFSPNTLALPLYGMHSPPSAGSPMGYHAQAPHAPAWAGHAPPPPTSYYSSSYIAPASYAAENSYSTTAQPPRAAPNDMLQPAPFNAQPLAHHPQYYAPQPAGPDLARTTVVGYELLADKLTGVAKSDASAAQEHDRIVPMYRKFEQLNHRVLLHLQDEIAELEEELRCTDECIAQCLPRNEAGQVYPASRRGDARYGGELQYKRTELLGRIYLKLGQYNQALSSFSSMLKNLDTASPADIQTYRTWLQRHCPIDSNEARFLECKDDLVAISRPHGSASGTGGGGGVSPHQRAAVGLPLIAVFPLMAFAIVPGLLARLFILTVIGAAEVFVVTSSELMGLMTVREWFVCASIYFGFMALLAGVTA